jgi:glycosyltransferase involved in cell wall biosynthesis
MKILSLGLDNSILDKDSKLAKRVREYGDLVEKYIAIAPSEKNKEISLSNRVKAYGVKSNNKILGLFKIFNLAKKIIKREDIDVITVQDQYYLGLAGLALARKFNIGLEIQVHGFEKLSGLRKIAAKLILPRADAVRCVSRRLKKRLRDEFGVKEDKITVAPIYSDIRGFEYPIGYTKPPDRFVFLTVGRLVPVKNIEMQIAAFKNLELRIKNLELWIVGEGPERKNLEFRIKNLELNNKIKLFGWQDSLDEFYAQADVFLLTSNYEGWGLAVIEAAAYGLPIIMTDVGCAGEAIRDGESGIIIPVGRQKKLEEAMVKLVEDENLRRKLGESARQAVLALPNKERTLELYKKSWEKAAENAELKIKN